MSLAARTREAVRESPYLYEALRAGVVNYAAAARALPVDGDPDAVAAALRRFEESLPDRETGPRTARVTLHGGVGPDGGDDPILSVSGAALSVDGGEASAVLAAGDVDPAALSAVLSALRANGVESMAAGVAGESLVVVVPRREGPAALRIVESALESAPA